MDKPGSRPAGSALQHVVIDKRHCLRSESYARGPQGRIRWSLLNTTNAIENLFGILGDQVRRVKNWNSGPDMRRCWAAAMVFDDERRFHRLTNNALLVDPINQLADADPKP